MDQQVICNSKHKLINVCQVKAKARKYGLVFIFKIKKRVIMYRPEAE